MPKPPLCSLGHRRYYTIEMVKSERLPNLGTIYDNPDPHVETIRYTFRINGNLYSIEYQVLPQMMGTNINFDRRAFDDAFRHMEKESGVR